MAQCTFSVSQSHPCLRWFESRGGTTLQEETSCEGVAVATIGGSSDMGAFQQSGVPLCFQGKPTAPCFFPWQMPHCTQDVQCGTDIACFGEGVLARVVSDSVDNSVANKVIVCWNNQFALGESMAACSYHPWRTVLHAYLLKGPLWLLRVCPQVLWQWVLHAFFRATEQQCEDQNVLSFQSSVFHTRLHFFSL